MIGIVLALLAALVSGLSAVLVRKRLDESNFFSATWVMAVMGNIIFWPLTLLFTDLRTVNLEGVLFFVIAGILSPGIVGLLYIKGMEIVGVSVSTSIFATGPVFVSIFAVLFLGEVLALENWMGIIGTVVGVAFIERDLSNSKTGSKRILQTKSLVFPLFGALIGACAVIVRKYGLNICNEPLLSAAIGSSLSLLLRLLMLISSNSMRESLFLGKDLRLFWKAGACGSFGLVLSFYALSYEKASIVAPLTQTAPLFVLFFAYLHLKELEHLSFKLIISSLLIIIGVMLVSMR